MFNRGKDAKERIPLSLPGETVRLLNGLAKRRNESVESLLQSVVTRHVQKYAPEPGIFHLDVTEDDTGVARWANALLVQAIDNGGYAIDLPAVDGVPVSINDTNGKPMLLPEHGEYWLRRRYEAMATLETGAFQILHDGRNYTVHVVFSGNRPTETMRLWIEVSK